ncbi:hypothetical protein CEXT_230111 [Caerostris extrusa]|uniref:Uncharacterized protein n=1 Tax=Caerostris extrusa TaxID=172846 RepID=A0AAV4UJ58_CAEEX|nr:hypothetical protein CEXT_230111 [Caerostris extrusa]
MVPFVVVVVVPQIYKPIVETQPACVWGKPYKPHQTFPHSKPTLLPSGALRNIRSSVNDLIQKVAIPKHSDKKITAGYHGHRIRAKGRVRLDAAVCLTNYPDHTAGATMPG